MKNGILTIVFTMVLFAHAFPISGSFTPTIDGTKDAGWGSTPDSTSASEFNGNPATDLYVTDDPDYLYILYKYAGDSVSDSLSSHLVVALDVSNSYGATTDPWGVGGTTFSGTLPDYCVRSYYNMNGGAKDVQFSSWNGSSWSGGGAMSESDHAETLGGWAELRIPLSTLKVATGDTVKLLYYWRYSQSAAGYSDAVPWNTGASLNSATSASLDTFYSYTIQADNINPVITATNPGHTATGLERDVNIAFKVTDNKAIRSDKITVTVEGNLAFTNGSSQPGYAVSIVTNTANKDYSITIDPDADFSYLQVVNVSIAVEDESGNTQEKTYYFTIKPDTTPPLLNNFNPGVSASGISRNAVVQFEIHDDDRVRQNSIWVTIGGILAYSNLTPRNGFSNTVTTLGDGYSYSLSSGSLFAFESSVPVVIYGKDLSGNTRMTNYSFSITPDNIAPTFANASPAPGAVNQARGVNLSFQLADNIGIVSNQIQTRIGSTYLIQNGAFRPGYIGSITYNGTGYDIVINPVTDFAYASNVTVQVTAQDARANSLTTNWSFSIKADDVSPTISGRTPAPGSTGLNRNSSIVLTLDDDTQVNASTIDIKINGVNAVVDGSAVAGFTMSKTNNGKGFDLLVNQTALFNYEQTVSVYVYCEDNNGNPLSTSYSFSIKSDDVAPILSSSDPAQGQTGVAINKIVGISLSDDASLNNASVFVSINGSMALSNGGFVSPYNGALSSMSGSGSTINISIDNVNDYPYLSTNTVAVTAKDNDNNLLTTNFSFIIKADDINPSIVNQSPAGSGQLKNTAIQFGLRDNVAVALNSLRVTLITTPDGGSPITNQVYSNSSQLAGYTVSTAADGSGGYNVTIDPTLDFNFLDYVQVLVWARDAQGNPVTGNWNFSVQGGDTTAPLISRQTPAPGSINQEPNVLLYFETSDDVEVLSNKLQVYVLFPGYITNRAVSNGVFVAPFNGAASSIVSNVNHGYDVTIDYTGAYSFVSTYGVLVSLSDSGLNTNQSSWSFGIRPPDSGAPTISNIVPGEGDTDIPIASSISFALSDNYGVSSNLIQVSINNNPVISNGVFLPAYQGPASSITANAQKGYNVIIDPVSDFNYGDTVQLTIVAVDTSGNSNSVSVSFSLQDLAPASARTSVIDPAQGTTEVQIKVNRSGNAEVFIYNIRGELVAQLPSAYYNIGDFISWDGTLNNTGLTVGSGWYFVNVRGSDINTTVKVLVIK